MRDVLRVGHSGKGWGVLMQSRLIDNIHLKGA